MQVYIGYSYDRDFKYLMKLLDVDPSHPEGVSQFESLFGTSYIEPGQFEIYGREDVDGDFTKSVLEEYFPFKMNDDLGIWKVDLSDAKCVFFIADEKKWNASEADGVVITDVINVSSIVFE